MKKHITMVGMMLVASVGQLVAGPSVSVSSGVANQYIAFGNGGILYGKAVCQSDIFVSFENGIYIDLWNSKSLEGNWGESLGDELDYGIGWSGQIGQGFGLNIGLTYFDEPMAMTFGPGDVWFSHVKVSHSLGGVKVFGQYENHTTVAGTSYEGGNLWSLGVSKSQGYHDFITVDVSGTLTYDDGAYGNDSGLLAKSSLGCSWKVSDHLTVVLPQLNLYVPWAVNDSRETEIVVYGGVSIH